MESHGKYKLKTPILFLIFNRRNTAEQVFEKIREQQPKYLYIAADGPRPNVPDDQENCRKTRAIIDLIDWDCELKTLFRDENLGCRNNVSQAISWFFENVEEGIILEDDCLPDPSFFQFCEEMLEFYRHDTRIMHISGNNFQQGIQRGTGSYYFSHIPHIWGWATWRRAWKYYDVNIASYGDVVLKNNHQLFHHRELMDYYKPAFYNVYAKGFNTWDSQWNYIINEQHALSILPNVNLISNIGFSPDALHTKQLDHPYNNLPCKAMEFPLKHPRQMFPDVHADMLTILREVSSRSILRWMARSLLKDWLPGFLQNRKILLTARLLNKQRKQ